eukprot:TRINITY_DN5799_c0_g1_i1.p2 TRINITY_DN5799_c0_g1~~TRINITY_DN5799_c0_g1_i1.p2  ORF type:complete len:57 (+),score=0.35 TRINITY_DN5799_c0_g1_i1:410-580(+)
MKHNSVIMFLDIDYNYKNDQIHLELVFRGIVVFQYYLITLFYFLELKKVKTYRTRR